MVGKIHICLLSVLKAVFLLFMLLIDCLLILQLFVGGGVVFGPCFVQMQCIVPFLIFFRSGVGKWRATARTPFFKALTGYVMYALYVIL